MEIPYVNIHTHHPTGRGIELRTAGIHPWLADTLDIHSPILLPDTVQAIGETGLDAVRGPQRAVQIAAFREQLRLAQETGLPVVVHCVRMFEPILHELKALPPRAVIFHGFVGSPEQAQRAANEGYYLSFGERTFSSPRTLEALRRTPLDRLFVETDESEIPIEQMYAQIATARGISEAELRRATFENYERLFI